MSSKNKTPEKTYSTPLAKKLGIREGIRFCVIHPPENYFELIGELPAMVLLSTQPNGCDVIHVFCNERDELAAHVKHLRSLMLKSSSLWISWYKKSAKLPTEVTEDIVREIVLPMGLVDVKVCAVDEKWTALKIVWRLENR